MSETFGHILLDYSLYSCITNLNMQQQIATPSHTLLGYRKFKGTSSRRVNGACLKCIAKYRKQSFHAPKV